MSFGNHQSLDGFSSSNRTYRHCGFFMKRIDNTFTEEGRIRFEPPKNPFKVVLVEPEIPLNTGSIARLCVATSSILVIAGEPSFSLDSSDVKRAGVDYWDHLKFERYNSFDEYVSKNLDSRLFFFSAKAKTPYTHCDFRCGDSLIFGKESTGLPPEILNKYRDNLFGIPTTDRVRSLNLSNAVSIVLYEALRRNGFFEKVYIS
jgi:tRNA (cytidine/uridine-2'-O-)-methyltransferase